MNDIIEKWCEIHDIEWDGEFTHHGKIIGRCSRNQNGPIRIENQGDLVVQGEPLGLKDGWLVINGTAYKPHRTDGCFAVRPEHGRPEIDGPLPEPVM